MATITVNSVAEAIKALDGFIENPERHESDELDYKSLEKWVNFSLVIRGEKYHSTLNANLMEALVDYQKTIYKWLLLVRLGDEYSSKAKLDRATQSLLNIQFHVKEGSSDLLAKMCDVAKTFGREAIGKMTPREVCITVLFISLCATCHYTYKDYSGRVQNIETIRLNNEKEIKMEALKDNTLLKEASLIAEEASNSQKSMEHISLLSNETIQKVVDKIPNGKKIIELGAKSSNKILKSVSDADEVSFQGVTLSKEEVRQEIENIRQARTIHTFEKVFFITKTDHRSTDGWYATLKLAGKHDEKSFRAFVNPNQISDSTNEILEKAVFRNLPVTLRITAKKSKGRYQDARVLSATMDGAGHFFQEKLDD